MPRLDFGRWSGTTKTIDMTLNGGKVGIGTPTPHAPLEVKGTDFQLAVTNAQEHNWGLTNWTDDRLYFQYREQGVYKNNAMWLDKNGVLVVGTLSFGDPMNNYIQKGINFVISSTSFTTNQQGHFPFISMNTADGVKIVGDHSGSLATTTREVLLWTDINGYGEVMVNGKIWAQEKNFLIDHPTKPDHYLIHACLEGPESSVYYRGQAQLADGRATIRLPDYFEALTSQEGRTVLLTPEGREPFLLSYEPIVDGAFKVYGTTANGAFSWEVKAVRSDVKRLETEVRKGRNQEYDRGNGGKGGNV